MRYPDVEVALSEVDGNAIALLGNVRRALKRAGHHDGAVEFMREARSGDYGHLLDTCADFVVIS